MPRRRGPPPSPAPESPGSPATVAQRSAPGSTPRPASPRTRRVTCSSPIPATAGCGRCRPARAPPSATGSGRATSSPSPAARARCGGGSGPHRRGRRRRRRPVHRLRPRQPGRGAAGEGGNAFGRPVTAGKLVTVAGTGVAGSGATASPAAHSELDDPTGCGRRSRRRSVHRRHRQLPAPHGGRLRRHPVRDGRGRRRASTRWPAPGSADRPVTVGRHCRPQLWDPGALAVDGGGDVLVADQGNRTIRVLTAARRHLLRGGPGRRRPGHGGRRGILRPLPGRRARRPWARPPRSTSPPAWPSTPRGTSTSPTAPCTPSAWCPPSPTTLLGKPASADDHVHRRPAPCRTGVLHNRTQLGPDPHARPDRAGPHPRRPAGLQRQPGRRGAGAARRAPEPRSRGSAGRHGKS